MNLVPPVLVINLATATRRWNHIQHQVALNVPDAKLIRMDAVDWRTLSLPSLPITLFTQYLLTFPQQQSSMRVSHRQLDTVSSVAILLSHVKCWEWLSNHPKEPFAMIMEDDACFDAEFQVAWHQSVLPMLAVSGQWDLLVLGYFSASGSESVNVVPNTQPVVTTKTVPQFFGAHAYIITQSGAKKLLKYVFPMDHHVDGLFLTLFEFDRLRLHMLRQSVVSQCMDGVNREGSWHTHTVVNTTQNPIVMVQSTSSQVLIAICVVLLLLVVGILLWKHGI